jgi:RHS repeat-associated protein
VANPRPAFAPQQAPQFAPLAAMAFEEYSSDVQNIVTACESDPKKLFDFVRNNVRFTPYFGFRKGADLTWLTRAGNDADQADLLVTLLKAAGFSSAQFEKGLLTIPLAQARTWIDADNDAALDRIFSSAGYYTYVNAGTFLLEQIWVSVSIDGTTYRMHPAYKTYTTVPGVDLAAAMGYSRAALLAAGGGTQTATYVQGVDDDAVVSHLSDRAAALINDIRTSHPNASVDEIVGGRVIVPVEIASLGDAFPSFAVSSSLLFAEDSADVPFNSDKLYVRFGTSNGAGGFGTLLAEIPTSNSTTRSIAGRRISLTFNPAGTRAQLWLDDTAVGVEAVVPVGQLVLELRVDHPYYSSTYADYSRVVSVVPTGSYVVLDDPSGYDSPFVMARRQAIIAEYQRQGLAVNSREIRTESLNLLGIGLMAQVESALNLLSRMSRFEPILHDTLGVIHQTEAFGVDFPLAVSFVPRDDNDAKRFNNLRVATVFTSAMEHGVIDQNYPSLYAMSAARYVRRNNDLGKKTYLATSANYSTISSDPAFIAGWPLNYRTTVFPSILATDPPPPSTDIWRLIIPEDGQQPVNQLTGNGFFRAKESSAAGVVNSLGYTLKGAFVTTLDSVDPNKSGYTTDPTAGPETHDNAESKEPVDLFTGAYVSDNADLMLGGGGARGLLLARSYSSAAKDVRSDIGYGWNHNGRSTLGFRTDIGLAFGQGTPEQTAGAITALYTLNDVLLNESTLAKGWLVSCITSGWLVDQLWQNAVDVPVGRKNYTFTWNPDFTTFSPAAGVTAQLIKDDVTGLYRIEERLGGTTSFDWFSLQEQYRISSFTDADGKTLSYAYNGDGRVQTITDCYARTLTFAYYGSGANQGLLQSVTDSTGRSVGYTYVGGGYLDSVTDPENYVTHFDYDADGRLWKVRNQLNQTVVENTYDDRGRVSQQIAEGDAAQTWHFAITGVRNAQIDPLGHRATLLYDTRGRQTGAIDALGHRATMAYDGQDHLVTATDPKNHTTTYQYDGRNNLRFTTNANQHTTEIVYDSKDDIDYILDPLGKKTDYAFDLAHHLTEVKDALLRATTFIYYSSGTSKGLLWKTIASNNDTTTFVYDGNGHTDTITRPDASVMDVTYNARGDLTYSKVTTTGDLNIHEVTMTYDKRRLLLTARDALNFGVTNVYDARGRPYSQTDRFGKTNLQTFSPWGRSETATMPNGAATVFRNDSTGRRDRVTNPLTQITQYGFDEADRLETVTDALNQLVTYGYDAADNRDTLTNTRNKTWIWTHTAVDIVDTLTSPALRVWDSDYNSRELLETFKEPSLQSTTFLYYDDQRLQQMTDPVGTVSHAYDTKARLDTVTQGAAVIDRDYDALNRLTKFTDAAGNVIEYTYDGAGHLKTLKYPGNKTVTYTYDTADRLDFVTDWANRVTDFQYDQNSRLSKIVFPNLTQRNLTYDNAGRVDSIRDETSTLQVISQFGFGYDVLNRIGQEIATPEAVPFTVLPATMTYDDDDRLLTWNAQTCVSDPDGNLTTGPLNGSLTTFGYDARNRLISAGGTTYAYDAENRRTSQTTAGVTTTYVHDPQDTLSRLLLRTTGANTTYYVHAAGMLLYEETGSATKTYHFDFRGSTVAITDDNQLVTDRVFHGPYGETVARQGTTNTPFLYHGAYGVETDANKLCYMRARYYSVEARRFLNSDPIGFGGGLNHYAYCNGNPVNGIDPLGLWAYFQPSTWFDGKGYQPGFLEDGIGQSAQAALDGLIPFADPFGDNGGYDKCDKYNRMSQGFGRASQMALTTAAGLGAIKAVNGAFMPETLYHFTSLEGLAGIEATGGIQAGSGLYGTGVYLTGFNSATMAILQGAQSTAAVVEVSTAGLNVSATYFPGTYIIRGASLLLH